jgi:shikimate kinase
MPTPAAHVKRSAYKHGAEEGCTEGETTMRRVLLTGMSGTGKSSVIAELKRRGFAAIDMDEPGWSVRDAEGHQLWCEERLREVLAAEHAGPVFVSGCAENQVKFYPQFSHIVLMSAPADVIKERLASRTDNHYGKRPDELAEVLHHLEWVEPLLRRSATHEIVTTMPLDRVVATVLSLAQASD